MSHCIELVKNVFGGGKDKSTLSLCVRESLFGRVGAVRDRLRSVQNIAASSGCFMNHFFILFSFLIILMCSNCANC